MKTNLSGWLQVSRATALFCAGFIASFAHASTVATPVFSPVAGTYTSAQSVTITSTTSGASIRYTTDGSTPSTTTGTIYSGPVSINATTSLKAIAYETGFTNSAIKSGTYTIKVIAPVFSPAAGTYTSVQSVTITSTTSGASLAYTTDGTTPTESGGTVTNGTLYSDPVSISQTTTLKAIAYETGLTDSAVTSGTYTIKAATPTFSPAAGTYTSAQSVTIASTTSGASINYTTDGSTPSATTGTLYSSPVVIGVTTTLKAIAYETGLTSSAVTSGTYTINLPTVATPTFSPAAGTYTSVQSVTITSTTSGTTIRYTTDGSIPSATAGTIYSSPVSIGTTTTLKAIAYETGFKNSAVKSGTYTINLPTAAGPIFSPAAGTFTNAQTVTITTTTSGASIRYTTDGSIPSATAGTLYSGPVSIGTTTTLEAVAYKANFNNSTVTSGIYTITPPPVITSSVTATGQVGLALSYQITASNGATGYNATGLPAGLSVDISTGLITGTPTTAGTSNITISASNSGGTGSATLVLTVNPEPVTFTVSPVSFTYNGSAQSPTITPSISGATYSISGTASATSAGSYTVTATATGNYTGTSGTIAWTITKATPVVSWATPMPIVYGTALDSTQLNATADVPGAFIYTPAVGTVLDVGAQTLSVAFTPTDATDYNNASASVSLQVNVEPVSFTVSPVSFTYNGSVQGPTITPSISGATYSISGTASATSAGSYTVTATATGNYTGTSGPIAWTITKATPVVSWATPTPIVYGTALDSTQLNATADVPGAFIYTPAVGTVLDVGAQTLSVAFTPTDATDYNNASASVFLQVNPEPVTFTVSPVSFTYNGSVQGPTITPSISGATYSISGTASATSAGSYTVTATATGNYTGTSGPIAWTITKATPVVSWAMPTPIVYGTALDSTQLNATADVPGAFIYTPAVGTVLNVGIQTLSVEFTPTDATDYNNASASVSLTVNPPPPSTPMFSPAGGSFTTGQSVSITSLGADSIYYTTDGTAPTTSSTPYAGAVTIANNTVLNAIGVNAGGNSPIASATFTILPPPPAFSPAPSTYTNVTTFPVTITDAASATIYYTTDGSTPTTASTQYTAAVSLPIGTTTLRAIAVTANGSSAVAAGTYLLTPPAPSTPVFSPPGGIYTSTQSVTITSVGATAIYYTTDGSTPTTASTLYTGAVTVSNNTVVQAIGANSGGNSAIGTANFTILLPAAAPVFSPAGGTYSSNQFVTITSASPFGPSIRYTTDGSTPTETHGTLYSGSVTISGVTTLKAIAYGIEYTDSPVTTASYTISPLPTPTFSPAGGTYSSNQLVTITSASAFGDSIRYTTDGSTPTETHGTLYSGPVTISGVTTLKAIGYGLEYTDSTVGTASYTISPLPAPTFSPAGGTYSSNQLVTITSASAFGDSIRYTTDGSTPTETHGTLYSGPVTISGVTTLKAIGYGLEYTDSTVGTASYTISPLPAPTFSPAGGTYSSNQLVTITSASAFGDSIRYTTDGSTPTETHGTLYSGPVTISGVTTLKAIGYGLEYTDSAVGTASYTIGLSGPYTYAVTKLSPPESYYSQAYSINNSGQITLIVQPTSTSPSSAFIYNNGNLTTIGDLPGGSGSTPESINSLGQVAGIDSFPGNGSHEHSYIYNSGTLTDLGTLPDGYRTLAYGINDSSKIVGYIDFPSSNTRHAFRYDNGTFTDLGTLGGPESAASGINNAGQVVGYSKTAGNGLIHAFIYSNGVMADLYNSTNGLVSQANAINNQGDIIGGGPGNQALIYSNGVVTGLGTLGGSFSGAYGINDSAQVVGYASVASGAGHAFFYSPSTGMIDLNTSVTLSDGSAPGFISLDSAAAINNSGQIIGIGQYFDGSSYSTQAFLLTPVAVRAWAPTFSPDGGLYSGTQTVTIASATGNASIRYTIDGSTPTETNGTIYSGPVAITPTTNLQAIAFAPGFADSLVTSETYYSAVSPLPAPTFDPPGGTYPSNQMVTISSTNQFASIRYTIDGSTPTETNGISYNGSVMISGVTTLKAIAYAPGMTDSAVTSATYIISPLPAPTFNPPGGTYPSNQMVTISSTGQFASIRYTIDGSTPTETNGIFYNGSVMISGITTLKAIAFGPEYTTSPVASATYTISPLPAPTFNPPGGTYPSNQMVTISSTGQFASIRYTIDGSTPTETNGIFYNGSVMISGITTLKAIAFGPEYTTSPVASATYTISPLPAPTFNPPGGTYPSNQMVTISSTGQFASIRYTIDGSTPTETNGIFYNGSVMISGITTLKAIAFGPEYTTSPVANATYTIVPPSAAPIFSPGSGTYTSAQVISITTITSGATIRYTTDGSTPTETNGTIYSGPVSISHSTILKAIAYETGFTDSPVTGGFYGINSSPAVCLNVLYDFASANSGGTGPAAGLVQGSDGNFYGTTQTGGVSFNGTVFRMTPSGVVTTLVLFNGTNGSHPYGGLVQGTDSNFYGATYSGGTTNQGTIFKMTPAGALTTLVSFNGANGANPYASLVQGGDGYFYGTTSNGGSSNLGTVFKMTPAGTLTTLVSFNGTNGSGLFNSLVQGTDGNLYGTTKSGGSAADGTVFKMTPAGVLTTLVAFTGTNGTNPMAGLVQGSDGNFYGTTYTGLGSNVNGTVFKMTPTGVLTTLASFNAINGGPSAALLQGSDGCFYGTTAGINSNNGIVFRITPAGLLTTLASFDGANGAHLAATLVQSNDGTFYGTTYNGGVFNQGVVFQLIVPPTTVAPVFGPAAGNYPSPQSVTITSTTAGATIRYTTDGSMPTETNGILYSSPVNIGTYTTLQAIAYASAFADSPVTGGTYTFGPPPPAPVFSLAAGTYTSAQSVTITCTGATAIRYTIDGSVPTSTSTLYTGPVAIANSTVLQALGFNSGGPSPVTSASYTIQYPQNPNFNLGANSILLTVFPGESIDCTITVTPVNGFNGIVNLSVSGLPAGVIGTFNPVSINGTGHSLLTISASTSALPGIYPFGITGTCSSPSLSNMMPLSLKISSANSPLQQAATIVSQMSLAEEVSQTHGYSGISYRYIQASAHAPQYNFTNGPAGIGNNGAGHGGPATAMPAPIALAASFDINLAYLYGSVVGQEAVDYSNAMIEGPDINIARVPQNGRTFEAYGEDPYLVGQIAVNTIEGLQDQGISAEAKHFAGNNQETNRLFINDIIDERTLREIYLPAFEASVVQGHVDAIMGAYNQVNGFYCCENMSLLHDILKGEWGFTGYTTSDFGAMNSTIGSALAGLDAEMPTENFYGAALQNAVQTNQLPKSAVDEMLIRRFSTMINRGVFHAPLPNKTIPATADGITSRQIAEAGMVLLKNNANTLPFKTSQLQSIALIGPFATSAMTGGNGSSHVVPIYTPVTPLAGIQSRVAGTGITVQLNDGSNLTAAAALARNSTVAIVMVGDNEMEGADVSISLSGNQYPNQDALIQAVAAANPRTIVVLKTGTAVLMPWLNQVPAVLEAWYPGEEDGNAVAAVLFGDVNPSGKLPLTFPANLSDCPANTPAQYPGVNNTATYSEGIFVGYRHYDAHGIAPLFPFGHGLSYTTFQYQNLVINPISTTFAGNPNQTVSVDLNITNIGPVAGSEVAQIYVHKPALPNSLQDAPQWLKGFQKVTVTPGQTGHIHVLLNLRSFAFWNVTTHTWTVAPGTYSIGVGSSSRDIRLVGQVTIN